MWNIRWDSDETRGARLSALNDELLFFISNAAQSCSPRGVHSPVEMAAVPSDMGGLQGAASSSAATRTPAIAYTRWSGATARIWCAVASLISSVALASVTRQRGSSPLVALPLLLPGAPVPSVPMSSSSASATANPCGLRMKKSRAWVPSA